MPPSNNGATRPVYSVLIFEALIAESAQQTRLAQYISNCISTRNIMVSTIVAINLRLSSLSYTPILYKEKLLPDRTPSGLYRSHCAVASRFWAYEHVKRKRFSRSTARDSSYAGWLMRFQARPLDYSSSISIVKVSLFAPMCIIAVWEFNCRPSPYSFTFMRADDIDIRPASPSLAWTPKVNWPFWRGAEGLQACSCKDLTMRGLAGLSTRETSHLGISERVIVEVSIAFVVNRLVFDLCRGGLKFMMCRDETRCDSPAGPALEVYNGSLVLSASLQREADFLHTREV